MKDLRETIKQIFRSFHIQGRIVTQLQNDVLAKLTNYKYIPLEKWLEIVELIKNRPSHEWMYKNLDKIEKVEEWFEVLEAKVAKLKETSK